MSAITAALHDRRVACACVGLFAFLLYANTLGGGFVADDVQLIIEPPGVRSLGNVPGFFRTPFAQSGVGRSSMPYYRPVVTSSFALDYAVGGPQRAWVFHLTNALAYALCCSLVFGLFRMLRMRPFAALGASLLFAALCVHTESVAWIAGRTDVFATMFLVASFLCFLRGRRALSGPGSVLWFSAAGALLLAGLLSKEVAVAALPLFVVYELTQGTAVLTPGQRRRRWIGPAVAAAVVLLFVIVRTAALSGMDVGPRPRHFDVGAPSGWATIASSALAHVAKLIMPLRLSFGFEVDPVESAAAVIPLMALAAVAGLLCLTLWATFKAPRWAFGLWWMWLGLAPALNLIPIGEMAAERFLFLPSVGFCLLVGMLIETIPSCGATPRGERHVVCAACALGVLIAAHAGIVLARNPEWRTDMALHRSTLRDAPNEALTHVWMAQSYRSTPAGVGPALLHYDRALELEPPRALELVVHNDAGVLAAQSGHLPLSLDHLARAIALAPDSHLPRRNLVIGYQSWSAGLGEEGKIDASLRAQEHARTMAAHNP